MAQKPTLVILAAGMASRYGSMKQVEGFGPFGETIMDYSIFDAIKAGFAKVVFIIREEFADAFKAIMEPKLNGRIETAYAYQALTDYLPEGFEVPAERLKPWGTAHAILCSQNVVKENFVVINADDFYGYDGFAKAYDFCVNRCNNNTWGIVGYTLSKTLSDHGTVSRGVCATDDAENLVSINERTEIGWKDGKVVYRDEAGEHEVSANSPVSMNFWCFSPWVFDYSEKLFHQFIKENGTMPKAEFFIPLVGDAFIQETGCVIKVIPTDAQWFGVTYKQDAPIVKASIDKLIADGAYPDKLWS
jgi:NDP-sugar pyrophosphorylase family protein